MWFESWYGDLVVDNESLFELKSVNRTMRSVNKAHHRSDKHIVNKSRSLRSRSIAAKDG